MKLFLVFYQWQAQLDGSSRTENILYMHVWPVDRGVLSVILDKVHCHFWAFEIWLYVICGLLEIFVILGISKG